VLAGIKHTADRERSGIFSTAARVLRAYRSPVALAASEHPSFDPDAFVASRDTVYIAAAATSSGCWRRSSSGCSPRSARPPTAAPGRTGPPPRRSC
jgi:hypothetical protein